MSDTFRLGIDIGGTFTDAVLINEQSGEIRVLKVLSTPEAPWQAVVGALHQIAADQGIAPSAIRYFVHGTTLSTNTVIERTGARTGLLVTEGFKDILEIGRMRVPDFYDLFTVPTRPLVERGDVAEIPERVLAGGRVRLAIDPTDVARRAGRLIDDGVRAVAVCFLHAYTHGRHESIAGDVVRREFPSIHVSLSSEVWPELREYERAVVTVIDAYVGPRMAEYFAQVERLLRREGVTAPILVTRSNGGIMSAAAAGRSPAQTLLSGPASGVMGASHLARAAGFSKVIALDIGGTSADIAIIDDAPLVSTESRVGDFPIVIPAVDVTSIGAGGGSIAWCDAGGVLKVGPRSAGAHPGPACLGRGGTEPTVTDAYVHLGIIHPDRFLSGQLRLRPDLSEAALGRLAMQLDTSSQEVAEAILDVATANMCADFVPLAAKRGIEPSDYVLLAYGGAGPTHACLFAEEAGLRRVIVPPSPGTLCALGALTMDVQADYVRSVLRAASELTDSDLSDAYAQLERAAAAWLREEAIPVDGVELRRSAEMRYVGQGFEINVPWPSGAAADGPRALAEAFHDRHHALFRHSDRRAGVEIRSIRVSIVGRTPKPPQSRPAPAGSTTPEGELRRVFFRGGYRDCAVYDRQSIATGDPVPGPCIIEQYDSTTFVTPGFTVRCDEFANLILERI
jgi:N-methylhydantoinase A